MSQEPQNFFDSRTIMAIVLVTATFIGWQAYMQKKYPDSFKPVPKEAVEKAETPTVAEATTTQPELNKNSVAMPMDLPQKETLTSYESETLSFELSSQGMGLRNFRLKKYNDRKGNTAEIGHPEENLLPMETRLLGRSEPLHFRIEQINPNLFVGRAQIGKLTITKTMEVVPERYLINYKVATEGSDDRFVGLTTALVEHVEPPEGGGFLMPAFEIQDFYVNTAETKERVAFGKEDVQKSWSRVNLAAVGSQYFTQAIIDRSAVLPEGKGQLSLARQAAQMMLQYSVLNNTDNFSLDYSAFLGPKSYGLLSSIDQNLAQVVDFGFFNWIARHILMMLKWFYQAVGNWGLAIILLTLLVRLVVLPLNLYSYKSMKSMQVIQPQIQALRERYKDDQQKQQQMMMQLMREHKVNPLGGCLPIFLQFPIFIALYQVLGYSIELYQAPFILWIQDLSLKDPYYILPVLMGVTMFFQQKITPTTMDPAQAKILMMMPLIFTFFMASLPSGLALYMFVGAIFGVVQQLYFMRGSTSPVSAAKEAKT